MIGSRGNGLNGPGKDVTVWFRASNTALAICGLALAGYVMFTITSVAWKEYAEDRRYESSALRADGKITGYTYRDGGLAKNAQRYTGHYANVSFSTPTGRVTIATERRYETPDQRQAMLGWEVDVLYFPTEPHRARVLQWWEPRWPQTLPLLLLGAAIFGILHLIYRWWRLRKECALNG